MAGVNMENDSGNMINYGSQPAQGGTEYRNKAGLTVKEAKIVQSDHMDGNRAEGVAYNSDESSGVNLTTKSYPEGTRMTDSTPSDNVN